MTNDQIATALEALAAQMGSGGPTEGSNGCIEIGQRLPEGLLRSVLLDGPLASWREYYEAPPGVMAYLIRAVAAYVRAGEVG